MSEEEKLEAIKKELEKTNEHLSWLSAWLVKLPVTFGVIWLIAVLWPTHCKTTEREQTTT